MDIKSMTLDGMTWGVNIDREENRVENRALDTQCREAERRTELLLQVPTLPSEVQTPQAKMGPGLLTFI